MPRQIGIIGLCLNTGGQRNLLPPKTRPAAVNQIIAAIWTAELVSEVRFGATSMPSNQTGRRLLIADRFVIVGTPCQAIVGEGTLVYS